MNMSCKKKFRKRDVAYFLVLYTLFFFMISYGFRSFIHRKERLIDIDEDGIHELIEPRGTPLFIDIYDDGTKYTPNYNSQGILTSMLKEDPKKNRFTWDIETQRWFPDQNMCIWIPYKHYTQREDVDADGIVEIVRRFECQFIDFYTITIIVDDDGTIIREEYVEQKLKRKVKMDIKGNLFMWDKETQKWLPIQHLCSAYILSGGEKLRIEDVDGDGVTETVREFYNEIYGITEVIIIDGDTIISEVYDDKGKLMARLIWDEETQQWLPGE